MYVMDFDWNLFMNNLADRYDLVFGYFLIILGIVVFAFIVVNIIGAIKFRDKKISNWIIRTVVMISSLIMTYAGLWWAGIITLSKVGSDTICMYGCPNSKHIKSLNTKKRRFS